MIFLLKEMKPPPRWGLTFKVERLPTVKMISGLLTSEENIPKNLSTKKTFVDLCWRFETNLNPGLDVSNATRSLAAALEVALC